MADILEGIDRTYSQLIQALEIESDIPSILLPCVTCNRTFRPEALTKHSKVCEKSLTKKRKKFDSSKQRIQGTELAEFLPILPPTRKLDKSPIKKVQSKWKEKHLDLVRTIREARVEPGDEPQPKVKPSDHECCPYCNRYFGPKAFDRHVEWCKEQCTRIQPKSSASIEAKERLAARTKYRAPPLAKSKRCITKEKYSPTSKNREPSPLTSRSTSFSTPVKKTEVKETLSSPSFTSTPNSFSRVGSFRNNKNVSATPVSPTTPAHTSATPIKKAVLTQSGKGKEAYNPFTSAERQMMELLGQDDKTKSTSSPVSSSSPNSNKNPVVTLSAPVAEKITSPVLVTSPKSAFIKFSPIEADKSTQNTIERLSPEHSVDTGSESKTVEEASNASTPLPDNSEQGSDKNKNPISLSSLSLCSSISIESIDSNKNFLRKGISHSAKNEEKRNEVTPLKRSSSISQSPRSGREFLRTKLKMEDLLYGPNMPVNKNDFFFGSPIDSSNQFQEGISNESSSDSSLHKSLSDAETLNAEQELLKSMTELLYISSSPPPRSQSPSIKFTPSLISSLQPSEPNSESLKQSKDEVEPSLFDQSPTIKFCPDSAYNSLNRKSPPDDMSVNTEKDSNSSGSEHSFPLVQPPNSARFCHECGAKYPVAAAKFCCQCGVRRLTI